MDYSLLIIFKLSIMLFAVHNICNLKHRLAVKFHSLIDLKKKSTVYFLSLLPQNFRLDELILMILFYLITSASRIVPFYFGSVLKLYDVIKNG